MHINANEVSTPDATLSFQVLASSSSSTRLKDRSQDGHFERTI